MKRLLLIAIIFNGVSLFAQTIPANRIADWSVAGYGDTIPQPALIFDITNFGGVGDSLTDNTAPILNAIDSLHGQRGVIYFPPGKYMVNLSINIPDSVILRGASSDSTWLLFNFGGTTGNCFNINGSIPGTFANVTGNHTVGRTYIIVDDTSGYTIGSYAEMLQNNGSWDTQPVFWADNSVGQIVKITNISGDTLFLEHPLRITYDSILIPRIRRIEPVKEAGIECMQIQRLDTAPGLNYNIFFNYAANCWVRGVESSLSVSSHIEIDASTNILVTGCYIHHSYVYDGVSTHGYGITLFNHSGECLITNNVMEHLRHSFSLQTGANGNVISYNYSKDPFRSEAPSNAGADISLHGHYPYMNLFEGNIVQNIQIDQTHGPSGPFNTFFRNRAELYGLVMSSGTVQSDSQNFVGNEIPNTQILMGNYILFGSGHFEYANNVRGNITPPGATSLNDSSYYLTSAPSFWQGTWPSIGMPNVLWTGTIPALDRYTAGIFTACSDSIILQTPEPNEFEFGVYPNPTAGILQISFNTHSQYRLTLKDMQGKTIIDRQIEGQKFEINLQGMVSTGIYLLEVSTNTSRAVKKIVFSNPD